MVGILSQAFRIDSLDVFGDVGYYDEVARARIFLQRRLSGREIFGFPTCEKENVLRVRLLTRCRK